MQEESNLRQLWQELLNLKLVRMSGAKTTRHTVQGVARPGAPIRVYLWGVAAKPWLPAGGTAAGIWAPQKTLRTMLTCH